MHSYARKLFVFLAKSKIPKIWRSQGIKNWLTLPLPSPIYTCLHTHILRQTQKITTTCTYRHKHITIDEGKREDKQEYWINVLLFFWPCLRVNFSIQVWSDQFNNKRYYLACNNNFVFTNDLAFLYRCSKNDL